MNKLFVGNLPFSSEERDIRPLFERVGSVSEVKVITDRDTGRSRGFAFVTMGTPEQAQLAIEQIDGVNLSGRDLNVRIAEDKPRNDRRR